MVWAHLANAQFLSKKSIEKASQEKFIEATYKLKEFLEIPNDGNFPDQIDKSNIKIEYQLTQIMFII